MLVVVVKVVYGSVLSLVSVNHYCLSTIVTTTTTCWYRTQGYVERSKKLLLGIEEVTEECDTWELELACFKRLHGMEQKAVVKRIAALEKEVAAAEDREGVLQKTYADLLDEMDELGEKMGQLANGGGAVPMETS